MRKNLTALITILLISISAQALNFSWFSQNDSRWKKTKLGNSRSSIGSSGCVVSCLSMLLNAEASNPRVTPDRLNEWLRKNGGFAGNLMRWQVPGQIDGSGYGLELQSQCSKANDWKYLSEELEKGNKVIVKVSGRSSHWVLVVDRQGEFNKASSYIVNDPGMDSFETRNLAHWGGFRAARSYSGNWLDEQSFSLNSKINVVPVPSDESFLYELSDLPIPADVFVTLENKLSVDISGYFILGLFDHDDNLIQTIDYEYASLGASGSLDLIYEMADSTPLNDTDNDLRIIYSKYFSSLPSLNEAIALPSPGLENFTNLSN
jgi:hypothetical protein